MVAAGPSPSWRSSASYRFRRSWSDTIVRSLRYVSSEGGSPLAQDTGELGHLFRPEEQEARDRRRGAVLLCPGQEAGGRRRLLHAGDEQPCGGHGVDVPGQRAVDEREEDVFVDLLQGDVLHQVGADPP